ncbi:MAG: hypothetical protein ACRESK_03305, partial [Gammaproteobacteria bacterium]
VTRVGANAPVPFKIMHNFDQYEIGTDSGLLHLETCEENRLAAIAMAQKCGRYLDIVSRLLDPPIFNNPEFIDALRQLIAKKRRPRVRIIVFDPEAIAHHGHLLIAYTGHFGSFIEIRKASEEFNNYNEFLLVADETAWLHRNSASRYEATANFNDRRQSKLYLDTFITMWNLAAPDPNLRQMKL